VLFGIVKFVLRKHKYARFKINEKL
jgi:hypothetical protein